MKFGKVKYFTKGILSILLVIAVLMSLAVPVAVGAEETTEGSGIYAVLYYVDPSKRTSDGLYVNSQNNLELVFQKGNILDSTRTLVTDKKGNEAVFSLAEDVTTYNSSSVPATAWFSFDSTSSNQNIVKVDFKDKIQPADLDGWFRGCSNLTLNNITHKENLDTSQCTSMTYTFAGCSSFTNFKFSQWTNFDTSKVTKTDRMFYNCLSLSSMDMSELDFNSCSSYRYMFYVDSNYYNPSNKAYRPSALKTVKFGKNSSTAKTAEYYFQYMFQGCTSLESVDVSEFNPVNAKTFNTYSMFSDCSSLKEIDFSKWYSKMIRDGASVDLRYMFKNCTSLEKVSFEGYPHTFGYGNNITDIFTGCKSLRELNLYFDRKTGKSFNESANNVFAGLDELSYITINDKWKSSSKWVPVKTTWKKVALAPDIAEASQVAVGTTLENNTLFTAYKSTYAGSWAAESSFGFNSNGGTPDVQFINGVQNTSLNYEGEIENPTREGYDFDGWYTERSGGEAFNSGDTVEQWTYYAHWKDHKYKLILNANGGYIPDSNDTKIEYNNLSYSELKKLSGDLFVNDGDMVLVGWNTNKNGTGVSYAPDDSVSMLTAEDGGEVTLYAVWYEPQAVVKFDSQGGSAVEDAYYDNLPQTYGELSESYLVDKTFIGWYTEAMAGEKVNSDDPVTNSHTLYAHWMDNPKITFDAGDGYFDGDSTNKQEIKVCKYNHTIGVMPTPENGAAYFIGWFNTSGKAIDSDTLATADTTYYAHWGYKPVFDTDGGVLSNMPDYDPSDNPSYTLTALPSIKKDNYTFLGWYHGDTKVNAGDTVDLSSNHIIKAKWQQKPYCTVTLNPGEGSLKTGAINPIKVYKDTRIAELPVPTRDGYDFEGWYLGNDGPYTADSKFTEDTTLTAKWTAKNVTVTFNAGEGKMDTSKGDTVVKTTTVKVAAGKTIPSIPGANNLDSEGRIQKSFAGWYTQPDGKGTKLETTTVINSNTTYYAYWVDNTEQNDTYGYTYYAQWNTQSDSSVTDNGDNLIFHPINGSNLSAGLKILFHSAGESQPVPAGGLKIKIPKYLFKDWSGKIISNDNAKDALSENLTLDESDSDYYIFKNKVDLQGNDIVITMNYTFSPLNVNGGYIDENGYYGGDFYKNDDFNVKIEVDMDNDGKLETDYKKTLSTEVHTKVDTSVSKFRSNVSLAWNNSWGNKPADADEYFYVTWTLSSNHNYSNYSQNFYLMWDENTVRDNSDIVYAGTGVAHGDVEGSYSNLKSNGKYTYNVVTKHRRDLAKPQGGDQWATVSNEAVLNVKWRSGYVEQFRTAASTKAYIPPVGGGDFSFNKAVPNMDENDSHFIHGGQELITNREEGNMPVMPYEIYYTENKNVYNPKWNANTEKYTAEKRVMTITDGVSGDAVISSNSGDYSEDTWLNSENLEDGDYYFDSLKLTVTEYDASMLGDQWSNPYEHSNTRDYDETEIWVRKMNSGEFKLFKSVAVTSTETEITLPDDTVGFKVIHTSEFYTTKIAVKTNLCLKPTARLAARVNNDISRDDKTLIKNKAKLDITCGEESKTMYSNGDDPATASTWPSTYVLDVSSTQLYARKDCASKDKVEVVAATSTEDFPVVVSGWNYNNSGNKKRFRKGEFYDLLPNDFSVDKNTVYIKPITENWSEKYYQDTAKIKADNYDSEIAEGTLSSGFYSVRFVNDWQNSGRTMMIVNVNIPDSIVATGVNLYYKMKTPYASIYTNGVTQMNMAAFKDTTDSQMTPESRTSTLADSAIDPNFKYCFEPVDSDFTAFASDTTDCKFPPIHESGINSIVHAESSQMTKHETIGLNSDYNYYISYGSGIGAATEDLVFYDVLEQRIGNVTSEWSGEFLNVDVSSLKKVKNADDEEAYCAPVVWYAVSTGDNAKTKKSFERHSGDEDDDFNLEKNTFWTTELPEDKSTVTAVAVDCRYDSKGNAFKLKPESTIGFNINMHSPLEHDKNNIYTFNEAVIRFTMSDTGDRVSQLTQTDVLLHYNIPTFEKIAFPSSGIDGEPAVVVKNSVLEYTLKLTNPDEDVSMIDMVVEDTFDATTVKPGENIRVKVGDGEESSIDQSARISEYSMQKVGDKYKFTATINTLDPGESVSIIIPVTVVGNKDREIVNTAKVTKINGAEYDISSNTNYHIIDDPKVNILKVNSKDEPLRGAKLQILNSDGTPASIYDKDNNAVGEFYSTDSTLSFSIQPGRYILRELEVPEDTDYKLADDIPFRIDSDGLAYVNNTATDCVKMVDEPAYKVIFHENQPNHDDEIFRIYEPEDLNKDKSITHFYDIPSFADDEYVFAGWYHNSTYSETTDGITIASNFEEDKYPKPSPVHDYHLYAKWIKVGTVEKDAKDTKEFDGEYRGFGLKGVQIRDPLMYDSNYSEETPEGMRFVTSLSERLLSEIDSVSNKKVSTPEGNVNVEYGYAVGTEDNINAFTSHYGIKDTTKYKLQYKGENVNGKNTNPKDDAEDKTADTDFRYITNVNCTRGTGKIKDDHRNFTKYRLYTLVVTYENEESAAKRDDKINARSYIRYYDANGKLRVFYNNYKKNMYNGGCLCSYNQAHAGIFGK